MEKTLYLFTDAHGKLIEMRYFLPVANEDPKKRKFASDVAQEYRRSLSTRLGKEVVIWAPMGGDAGKIIPPKD